MKEDHGFRSRAWYLLPWEKTKAAQPEADTVAAPKRPTPDWVFVKLEQYYQDGLLTEEEYLTKRSELDPPTISGPDQPPSV